MVKDDKFFPVKVLTFIIFENAQILTEKPANYDLKGKMAALAEKR